MDMLIKNFFLILFITGLVFLFWFSLIPDPPQIPSKISGLDKIEHFGAYLILSFLLMSSIRGGRFRLIVELAIVILVMTAIGGLIEVLQAYTGRSPEAADLLADFAGAVCGSLLSLFLQR